jgi:hypothetical protein
MNERIRQLERQATETVKCGLNGTSTAESFNRKKFAELIVRECAKRVDYWESRQGEHADDLLKHFGVEE